MNMYMYRCIWRFLIECVVLIRVALPAEDIGPDGLLSDCTEWLALLAHSVFVLALSHTSVMTLVWHRSMLHIETNIVILILWYRYRLVLVAHLECFKHCSCDSSDSRLDSHWAAEVRFQPEPAPAVCSQCTRLDDAPDPWVDPWVGSGFRLLLKKWEKSILVSIFDQFDIDFQWRISGIRLGPLEGTGTRPDDLVNCVLTKSQEPHRKKIVRKSRNSFQVNSGGVGTHRQFDPEPK